MLQKLSTYLSRLTRPYLFLKQLLLDSLGAEFGETRILDLEQTWSESDEKTPLICILSIGSDPTMEIEGLAKGKKIPIKVVSMGQGQELFAKQLITDSMANGSWTLLQNCHLCLPFCEEIMDLLGESTTVNPNFRLWLTTECHPSFPIGLLHAAIKFTNEPPQGIRASIKRTYQSVTQVFEICH
jgi:dynein heavy chain